MLRETTKLGKFGAGLAMLAIVLLVIGFHGSHVVSGVLLAVAAIVLVAARIRTHNMTSTGRS